MSEPIKKGNIAQAPTPQNTPASNAGSYMTKAAPTIPSTISEDDELRARLLTNPALLSAIEGKLNQLIGQDSGYLASLSKGIKKRVWGLKGLQEEQFKLEAEFQADLLELERKYQAKFAPIYAQREDIVIGKTEPSDELTETGKALMEEDEEEEPEEADETDEKEAGPVEDVDTGVKGIPSFWLTALENLAPVSELISDADGDVLTSLVNIRMDYLDTPGFKLTFEFGDNEFFSNKTLSKTYYYQKQLGYTGDFLYDHAEGCDIAWKDNEHNVTLVVEKRKQRNKHTKQVRTIEKLTPVPSFFDFFDPPVPPSTEPEEKEAAGDDDDDDDDDDAAEDGTDEADVELEQSLQMDYEVGELIKDKLIPRAVDWFTGDALEYEYQGDEDEDEEDEEEDEGDEEEAEEGAAEAPAAQPDCKQQ